MPCKQQSDIFTVYQTHALANLHKQIEDWLHLKFLLISNQNKQDWSNVGSFKVFGAIGTLLLESHAHALTSLSLVAGDQVRSFIWFDYSNLWAIQQMKQVPNQVTNQPTD
jgi:hypothetical protein